MSSVGHGSAATVELDAVPALGGLYARGVAGSVAAAAARRRTVRPADVPGTRVVVRGVRADAEHLSAYQHLVGEPASDLLPAGFVHVLAFPVATALMVRREFPLPLLGMVHLANHVEQRRAVRLGEALDVHVHAEGLAEHRAGVTVDVVATVEVDGEVTWVGRSTYLAKGFRLAQDEVRVRDETGTDAAPSSGGVSPTGGTSSPDGTTSPDPSSGPSSSPDEASPASAVPTGRWRLAADTGRRYAAVSGDQNPIHTSALAARAFGFPRAIAHGMYTASRALADVGPRARGEAFVWEVTFAKPVLLPSTVQVRVVPTDSGHTFAVWSRSGRRHLEGSVRPLEVAPAAPV